MSSTLLDPRVIDASTLIPRLTSNIYLPIAVEGQADVAGNASVGPVYMIDRVDESSTSFGANSAMHRIVQAVLDRGAGPVIATVSAKGTVPTLAERQAAWAKLESDESVRLRLTDSELQADLAALAVSAGNADLVYNKQIAIVGLPSGTGKSGLISGAAAIAASPAGATRSCLVAPGVFDQNGIFFGGSYAAACVAAEVAKNAEDRKSVV